MENVIKRLKVAIKFQDKRIDNLARHCTLMGIGWDNVHLIQLEEERNQMVERLNELEKKKGECHMKMIYNVTLEFDINRDEIHEDFKEMTDDEIIQYEAENEQTINNIKNMLNCSDVKLNSMQIKRYKEEA